MRAVTWAGLLCVLGALATRPTWARAIPSQDSQEPIVSSDVFRPLLADPEQSRFMAAYLADHTQRIGSPLVDVGLGQTFGLARFGPWQISLSAGAFSQFTLATHSADLVNTDFLLGLPITYRHGAISTRLRVYHQSSHLGDEYLLHTGTTRVDLTYGAVEALVAVEHGRFREYGGGEYIFQHHPSDLAPGRIHGGVEYRGAAPVVHLGRFGAGRIVAAVDAKSLEARGWRTAISMLTGLDFGQEAEGEASGWRWRIAIRAYGGPSPYGQFYTQDLTSLGVELDLIP